MNTCDGSYDDSMYVVALGQNTHLPLAIWASVSSGRTTLSVVFCTHSPSLSSERSGKERVPFDICHGCTRSTGEAEVKGNI